MSQLLHSAVKLTKCRLLLAMQITGKLMIGGQLYSTSFFKDSHILWNPTMSKPRRLDDNPTDDLPQSTSFACVHGSYRYPFNIAMPDEVVFSSAVAKTVGLSRGCLNDPISLTRQLPPSFDWRPSLVSISYTLNVLVRKGSKNILNPNAEFWYDDCF